MSDPLAGLFEEGTVDKPVAYQDYPIQMSPFDFDAADHMREKFEKWGETEVTRKEEWEDFPLAMDTFFSALYKPKPRPEENLTKRGRLVRDILDEVEETQEWKNFRHHTVLDRVSSAMGAIAIGEALTLPDDLPDEEEGGEPGDEPMLTEEQKGDIRRQVRAAIQEASEQVQEQKDIEGLMWGNDSGDFSQQHAPEERIALAKRVKDNQRLRKLAKIVGRMRLIADEKYRDKVVHGRDELTDIVVGDTLFDIIPAERVALAIPELEDLFYFRYLQKNLLQYEFTGIDSEGIGPIVARIDISGSMGMTLGGPNLHGLEDMTKLDWAIAIALSLTVIAKKEKRPLNIGFFDTMMKQSYNFPKGEINSDDVLQIASTELAGGTEFEPPLRDALNIITANPDWRKADILFISDGMSSVSSGFLEEYDKVKEEYEVNTYSVLLNHGKSTVMERISERVITIANLAEAEEAMDMAFTMGGRE